MMYLNAFPRVWSSPSNWKEAALSVAPASCTTLVPKVPRRISSRVQRTTRILSRSIEASISSPCSDVGSMILGATFSAVAAGILLEIGSIRSLPWFYTGPWMSEEQLVVPRGDMCSQKRDFAIPKVFPGRDSVRRISGGLLFFSLAAAASL